MFLLLNPRQQGISKTLALWREALRSEDGESHFERRGQDSSLTVSQLTRLHSNKP